MTQTKWVVPYIALGTEAKSFKKDYLKAFEKVLLSGHYILGPQLSSFEKEFALPEYHAAIGDLIRMAAIDFDF